MPFLNIKKLVRSFLPAFKGLKMVVMDEQNMRVHVLAAILVTAAGFYFRITQEEWCIVIICMGMVTSLEAMNSAVEQLTNLAQPQYHPLAGKIKDMASAAVLIAAIAAAAAGTIVFWKYFFGWS
ncbi:MAG: diacylglycerol kinase [Chitinophagales bacterium]|nr:MAG: diacylglycerol kinase [Chitinophagales bacterium]